MMNEFDFMTLATKYYDNIQCSSVSEFNEDLKIFNSIKKYLKRFREKGEINERLILNRIITTFNLWGVASLSMLFFKVDKEDWNCLASIIDELGLLPEEIPLTKFKKDLIVFDEDIKERIRNL